MNHFLKYLSAIALASPIFLSADLEMRLAKIESQTRESLTGNARGTFGAKLADASPNVDGYGFYLSASALWYKLYEDNNGYALITNAPSTGVASGKRSLQKSNFDWEWGFKAGLGYYFEHDFWQTGFEFSYLNTQTSDSALASSTQDLYIPASLSEEFMNADNANNVSSHDRWKVTYYNLDWRIGKDFFVSKYLSFLTEFGVKSAWLYQDRTTSWSTSNPYTQSITFSDDYQGVGPKADLVAKFWLGRNFSLAAGVDTALLFAKNKLSYHGLTYATAPTYINFNNHTTKNHLSPYMGMNLGLAYDTNFNDDNFNFGIKVSYDQLWYYNANRMFVLDQPSSYNVYMQGLSINLLLAF